MILTGVCVKACSVPVDKKIQNLWAVNRSKRKGLKICFLYKMNNLHFQQNPNRINGKQKKCNDNRKIAEQNNQKLFAPSFLII